MDGDISHEFPFFYLRNDACYFLALWNTPLCFEKCYTHNRERYARAHSTYDSLKQTLQQTRKRLAVKLQNPRLLKITFHTFRHWKATTLYHQTKDIYYVKEFLGHRSIKNTEIYITIERTIFSESSDDEFKVKVAEKPEDIKNLLEVGFKYICERNGLLFFRKRK